MLLVLFGITAYILVIWGMYSYFIHLVDSVCLLCDAVRHGDSLKIWLYITVGADPNAFSESGRTALMEAARFGRVDTVRMLLEAGANTYYVDNNGKTALDIAQEGYDSQTSRTIIRLIRNADVE